VAFRQIGIRLAQRRHWRIALLVALDVLSIHLGFVLAYWIRYELQWPLPVADSNYVPFDEYVSTEIILIALLLVVYALHKVYAHRPGRNWMDETALALSGTMTGTMLMIVLTYFMPELSYSRGLFPLAAVTILFLLTLSRIAKNVVLNQLRKRGVSVKQVLVVGAGEVGRTVMRTIVARPELGYRVAGFVDDDPTKGQSDLGRIRALGDLDNITEMVCAYGIDIVIITLPWMYHRKILRIVRQCERQNVQSYIVPDLFQITISQVGIEHLGEVPMIGLREETITHGWRVVKRVVDIFAALGALILGAPIWLLISLAIVLDSPGPVIFRQTRLGERERPFTFFKFRTMVRGAESQKETLLEGNGADRRLFKMKDDPRVTRVGRWLRKHSMDEIPQFINVLRGDMSIVGPRPAIPSEVEGYLPWHRHRLDVPAGITGMWQVSGRSDLSFDEAALLDIWYAENWSFLLDLEIMVKTVGVMLLGRGAY
jgi:exopolysaccharide biosynthesis polyprenyl glycosylphosphotransferase